MSIRATLAAASLAAVLGAAPGCAHHKITNREVAIGAIAVTGVVLLVILAVDQCHKGAAFCDNSPPP